MSMSKEVYDYLQPTLEQIEQMKRLREAAAVVRPVLAAELPPGADRAWVIRNHRTRRCGLTSQSQGTATARRANDVVGGICGQ